MKIRRWRHAHDGGHGRKKHQEELAERLAPLEETGEFEKSGQHFTPEAAVADDTITVNSQSVKMPEKFLEEDRSAAHIFRLEPVVIVLLLIMLGFVAFIAWKITEMPAPAK